MSRPDANSIAARRSSGDDVVDHVLGAILAAFGALLRNMPCAPLSANPRGRMDLRAFGYAGSVALLACPFCREMFEKGEAKACPVCGMALTKFENLPPSHDAMHDEGGVPLTPEFETLPWRYLGRGKGVVTVFALVGLVLFFLPWVRPTLPYIDAKSAYQLAHERIGWLWATFAAWVVLVPTVMSRRTIVQLRGARVAAAFLSAIPAVAITILLAKPPHGGRIPVRYTWDWPMFATLGLSLGAIVLSARLGGRVDDIKVGRGTSKGQPVH